MSTTAEERRAKVARLIDRLYGDWMDSHPDDRLDPEPLSLVVAGHVLALLEGERGRVPHVPDTAGEVDVMPGRVRT